MKNDLLLPKQEVITLLAEKMREKGDISIHYSSKLYCYRWNCIMKKIEVKIIGPPSKNWHEWHENAFNQFNNLNDAITFLDE